MSDDEQRGRSVNGGRILVVDDNPLDRKLLRALLTLGQYEIVEFPDAESGIRHAREHLPDCILMDLRLPGMDGLAATRLIKADAVLGGVPVVAVTSFAAKGDERKSLDAGCDGYITKPIDTRTFLRNIRHFLRWKREAFQKDEPVEAAPPRALVVDDDPAVRAWLRRVLEGRGYTVIEAASGEEALAEAARHAPDLVLLDIVMPGLDGYEVTRRLKANLATMAIPVILVTGLSDTEHRVRGLEAGADEFLTKPVDSVELLVRMQSMINFKRSQDHLARRVAEAEAVTLPLAGQRPGKNGSRSTVLVQAAPGDPSADAVSAVLQEPGGTVLRSADKEETLSLVAQRNVDILVICGRTEGREAFELSRVLKDEEGTRNIQIIAVVPSTEPSQRLSALEDGVDDCMASPLDPQELGARLKMHIRRKARLDELQARYRAAASDASKDGLTGLVNNTAFKRLLDLELKRSRRHSHVCALLIADIDEFKRRNDTLGHLAGDLLLSELAGVLKAGVREIDVAARYGGEEFAVLLPDTNEPGARLVGERLRAAVASHVFLLGSSRGPESLTISIGMAHFPADADTPEELIRRADARLYTAKNTGKNRLCADDEGARGSVAG